MSKAYPQLLGWVKAFSAMAVFAAVDCSYAYADSVELRAISSRPDVVSGGDVLVAARVTTDSRWTMHLNGRDVTAQFKQGKDGGAIALLTGLKVGKNTLDARANGKSRAKLELLNHPRSGPIFSGPHQQPFICQTEANGLGSALDADCAAKTVVQYYYKSTEPPKMTARDAFIARYDAIFKPTPATLAPGFKPHDPAAPRPSDISRIVLPDGKTVDYLVRREIGVINRAVYEIQFLHEPGQPLPTPWTQASPGWNGRLVYTFGGGCGAGYRQGVLPTFTMSDYEPILTQGYALVTSSLNVLGNNCNDRISAETASMVKEHFIEQYGEPAYTIGVGGSGGAVSVYMIAQNYPGILDGIIPYVSAPDMVSGMLPFSDCALLQHALSGSKHTWTEAQKAAVSGFATWRTCMTTGAVLRQLGWLDPKGCDSSMPKEMIYDRISNPNGTRCTLFDNNVNVYGRDPETGFARRTIDNVGIQYGLVPFNTGKIDAEQFVELNERMGGFDQDGQIVPARNVADPQVLRLVYERGVVLTGKSLSDVPIIDWIAYADDLADLHTRDRAFITRARLVAAHGNAGNQAVLATPRPINSFGFSERNVVSGVGLHVLVPAMDRWLGAIKADRRRAPVPTKIIGSKPDDLMDGCIAADGERIVEPATYGGSGRCNQMYPLHGNPRTVAGEPIAGGILKCELKPVDPTDYSRPLTDDQLKRLKIVFAQGVCDYSRPGVGWQMPKATWQRF